MDNENDPIFSDENQQKIEYKNLKFGKVGDWFRGTLTDNTRKMENQAKEGKEIQTIFEFKAHGGLFHNIIDTEVQDEPTVVNKGEFWSYIIGGVREQLLKKANIGDIVGLKFVETKKSKTPGRQPAKIINVYIGGKDPEYQGETGNDQ